MDMIKRFADTIADYDEKYMVTEIWSPYDVLIKLYHAVQQQWFMPFNFGLIMLPWTVQEHKQYIDQYEESVGQMYLPNYVLGNHDKPRVASRIGPDQARIGAMLTLTLRGIPYIYYGEELGMEDTVIPPDRIQDTFEKTSPGLQLGRDPERTPMQWNTQKNAGFTTGEPWLPVNENYTNMNVDAQEKDKKSMLSLYKELIHLRKSSSALLHGTYESWDAGSDDVFVYSRNASDETLVIMLNYSDKEQAVSVPFAKGTLVLDTFLQKEKGMDIRPNNTVLAPHEGIIVKV
jgi:alpha-glucosidase